MIVLLFVKVLFVLFSLALITWGSSLIFHWWLERGYYREEERRRRVKWGGILILVGIFLLCVAYSWLEAS